MIRGVAFTKNNNMIFILQTCWQKKSKEPEESGISPETESRKRNVWLSGSRDQDCFQAWIKYVTFKPLEIKDSPCMQSLHKMTSWSSTGCRWWWPLFAWNLMTVLLKLVDIRLPAARFAKLMESSWDCLSWGVSKAGRVSDGPLFYSPISLRESAQRD